MKRFISVGLIAAAVFMAAPAVTYAAGLTSTQVQAIISLLQSFGADASVIADVQSALTGTAPVSTGTGSCLDLSNNLYVGVTDAATNGEVTKLQQFLGVNTTGYFGPMTLQAVQSWQSSHGVVSSGTPDTTGYGFVGPATRAAMACGNSGSEDTGTTTRPSPVITANVSPASITAGQSATLNWTTTNATRCWLRYGYSEEAIPVSGSKVVAPSSSTLYTLGCANEPGDGKDGPQSIAVLSVPVSGTTPVTTGTLSVSTDASSPAYRIVAGGSTGVTLGSMKLHATGENIILNKVRLTLVSGATPQAFPADIVQVTLWDGNTQVGSAYFTGNQYGAISTLSQPVTIPRDSDKTITIKGDIAAIGTAQPARAGDLVQIAVDTSFGDTQGTGSSSGHVITATGSASTSGVRIFKSYPVVTQLSLSPTGVADGRLLRFAITADPAGRISVGKLNFLIAVQGGISVSQTALYVFSDSSFSQPVSLPGNTSGNNGVGSVTYNQSGMARAEVSFSGGPLQIPAGATYYFELRGSVAPYTQGNLSNQSVIATLTNDSVSRDSLATYDPNNPGPLFTDYFVWSPNDRGTSLYTDADWTNSYGISGLTKYGPSQTRSIGETQTTSAPTCSIVASPTTVTAGQQATVSWTSANATSLSIGGGVGTVNNPASGQTNVTVTNTTTFTGTATGPGGTASCSASVQVSGTPPSNTTPVLLSSNKTATASSYWPAVSGYPNGFPPKEVTDGVLSSDYNVFASARGDLNPYVEIDLGNTATLSEVKIYNRATLQIGRLRDVTVTVYDASHQATYTSPVLNPGNVLGGGSSSYDTGPATITQALSNVSGRYVRVTRAGTGSSDDQQNLCVSEIQVSGN